MCCAPVGYPCLNHRLYAHFGCFRPALLYSPLIGSCKHCSPIICRCSLVSINGPARSPGLPETPADLQKIGLMRHASLFTGIGGFDLAARWMGWDNVFQAEIDPFCLQVLSHHFPHTERFDDVRKIKGGKYHEAINILSAGFPCQPFSVAGKRKGRSDDRFLWPETLRIITEIRPRWIVLENVAGLLSILEPSGLSQVEAQAAELFCTDDRRGDGPVVQRLQRRIIGTIMDQVRAAGYLCPRLTDGTPVLLCVPACSVGAPHRRDRVWIVAHADNDGPSGSEVRSGDLPRDEPGSPRSAAIVEPAGCGRPATAPGAAAHTDRHSRTPQAERKRPLHRQEGEQFQRWPGATGQGGTTADTNGDLRSQGRLHTPGPQTPGGFPGALHAWDPGQPWEDFPSESPICRPDDGLSSGLAGISFSRWRRECIRGFGNAIVPQIALQIFKAIAAHPEQ